LKDGKSGSAERKAAIKRSKRGGAIGEQTGKTGKKKMGLDSHRRYFARQAGKSTYWRFTGQRSFPDPRRLIKKEAKDRNAGEDVRKNSWIEKSQQNPLTNVQPEISVIKGTEAPRMTRNGRAPPRS